MTVRLKKCSHCDVCTKSQCSNSFVTGCNYLKKDCVVKHACCKDHKDAVEAAKMSQTMKVCQKNSMAKSELAVTAALKNVYFVAKENMANSAVPKLNEFLSYQGVKQLDDLKCDSRTDYEHSSSVEEFQHSIASVLQDELLHKVNESCKFSLMFDESTDVSVHQNIIMYIRILVSDDFGQVLPSTHFLGIESLSTANAESIFNKVTEMLQSKGIDMSKLCGLSTDGAAVMLGNRSGVVTRLKKEAPGVLATHCIAHRLALSCCKGADSIPYLVKVQEILNSVYKYFHYSPKNMAMLEAIQSVTLGQSSRFKEVFHTRWLSFDGSVSAMIANYSSLISVFLEEKSGKALSLHKSLTCYKFLYVVHFLSDVLKPLCILSKMYQKTDLDFTEVTPLHH